MIKWSVTTSSSIELYERPVVFLSLPMVVGELSVIWAVVREGYILSKLTKLDHYTTIK